MWYGSGTDLSDMRIFTWASSGELFEEVEKSTETLDVIERSSVKVVGHSYGSSKARPYRPQPTDITFLPWPRSACGTGQRRATVWVQLEEARN